MIHWSWLVITFMLGGIIGFWLFCLLKHEACIDCVTKLAEEMKEKYNA